jgi:MFS family permease
MSQERRREVGQAVVAAALATGATVAQLVGAKAARDALFLSSHDVKRLPEMMAAAAAVSLVAAVLAARAMARWAPARVVPAALAVNAALFGGELVLLANRPAAVGITLYLQVAFLGSTLTAGTWALINECFDPHTAKRVIGRVAMGGTAGGALGGLLGFLVGQSGGVAWMLGALAALNLVAVVPVALLARRTSAQPAPARGGEPRSGFDVLQEHPYLRQLAFIVVLVSITSALLDYVMSARVVARSASPASLMAFFAIFHMSVGLASFAVQALGTRPMLQRVGLAGTMAALPLTVAGASALAWVWPGVVSAVATRGADALVQSSLYRAAYEVAYTPVPRAEKRPVKMLVDVGFDRIGTALGSGLIVQILPRVASVEGMLLLLALGTSVVSLLTAARLHAGYVRALARSLERGAVRLSERDVLDATTRRTLAETSALSRSELLAGIAALRKRESERPSASPGSEPMGPLDGLPPDMREEGFGAAPVSLRFGMGRTDAEPAARADLTSGDAERVRLRLADDRPLEPELARPVIELLGHDELSRDALRALRRAGDHLLGELVAALADDDLDVVVRRRIPRALETSADPRATRALVNALFAKELDVRRQAAFALQRHGELASGELPRDRVLEAVARELDRAVRAAPSGAAPSDDALASVEHAVVVLSLVLEREPLSLAYRALGSGDVALRGTALEYFENVLPEALRVKALPLFDRLVPRDGPKRDPEALREALLRTRGG